MARAWLLLIAGALLVDPATSASFDEHRLRGGRDEVQSPKTRTLKPDALAKLRKAAKPKAKSPIEDINATAVAMVANANDTMYSVFADVMSSFDEFAQSVGQVNSSASTVTATIDGEAADSILAFIASISSLVNKAREELTMTTMQRQTALKMKWALFDAYIAKANETLEAAAEVVDKVVQDAKSVEASESGQQVLLQMNCCSGSGEAGTSRGIWDWIKNTFGGGASLCGKAHESISSANATIDKLSEGLRSTNVSVSDGIHEWGDAVKARVQLLQTDVNSTGSSTHGMPNGICPEVSEALEVVPAQVKKALKKLHTADLEAAKSLTNSNVLFKAAYDLVNNLDLQATAACAAKAAAKKKSAGAPCDHRC